MERLGHSPAFPVACFAPDLTDEMLAKYRNLVEYCPEGAEVADAMRTCLKCVEAWYELPVSEREDVIRWKISHAPTGLDLTVIETPLETHHIKALFDVTPWISELERLSNSQGTGLFDGLPPGEIRDCAFHLLWHAKEIALDREPMTQAVKDSALKAASSS